MHETDLVGIGKRIQSRRKQLGLTQEHLAEQMNVSVQMISNLERGNKAIRIDNLVNLSNILNISTDYILTGKETITDLSALTERIQSLTEKEQKMIELLIDFCSNDND